MSLLEIKKINNKSFRVIIGGFIFIVIIILVEVLPDSNKNIWQDFYDASFSNIVDSVYYGYRVHKILVNNKWYRMDAGYYTDFIKFTTKGDSLFKNNKAWDIIVKKKSGDKWIKKIFKGGDKVFN